jgi:hypothetical protein
MGPVHHLWSLSDDDLLALIVRLDAPGQDRRLRAAALNELVRRLRAEAAPDELSYVEGAIDHLTQTFSRVDDDEGPMLGGVREPRRPPPDFDVGTVRLAS